MDRAEIIATIRNLANVQGFYGRVYRALLDLQENNPEGYELTMRVLEEQNFEDATDLVLYFEC